VIPILPTRKLEAPCFDSHPRIESIPQKLRFCYGLLENAIALLRQKH
jgi:hypothetical protein